MKRKSNSKFRSDLDASIYEAASDLFEVGLINIKTMKKFDKGCLTEVLPLSPSEIVEVRCSAGAVSYTHLTLPTKRIV